MKKLRTILLIILFLLLVGVISFYFYIKNLSKPISSDQNVIDVRVEIPSGMSVSKVSKLLKQEGLIRSDKLFYYSARFPQINKIFFPDEEEFTFTLRSGIYHIQNNMNIVQIQKNLSSR